MRLSKKLINNNPDFSEGRKEYEQEASEEMCDRLDLIMFLKDIVIELIGSWIWITGNTFPVRETLKGEGYKFSHPKAAWSCHKGKFRQTDVNGLNAGCLGFRKGGIQIC